jgi:hypothetical protein
MRWPFPLTIFGVEQLGERFFQMLITDALLGQRPMLTALEITVNANLHSTSNFTIPSKAQKDRFFSSNYVTLLVRQYGLLNRLRVCKYISTSPRLRFRP